jgi:SAM-dependent methyltransferase
LLRSVQMTPWIWEYLDVGRVCAESIRRALEEAGLTAASSSNRPRVLDFGCGLGRTLRFLQEAGWELEGCDVDRQSIAWAARAFPDIKLQANDLEPPLPYPEGRFDALYGVSVFTHFGPEHQRVWASEVSRVLRPGGLAAITSMGPHAFGGFEALATPDHREILLRDGFFFDPKRADHEEFNARGAFHTSEGLAGFFGEDFELVRHASGGVDGFQDLTVLRKIVDRRQPST